MQAQQILTEHASDRLFQQLSGGSFSVIWADGSTKYYGDAEPKFTLRFKTDDLLSFLQGDLLVNFGEAYMNSLVDVEGDLADLVSLGLRNGLISVTQTGFSGTMLSLAGKLRSAKREKENVAHHYDLGNDFFSLWLDESLTYSCAYFRNAQDSLGEAQQQKIDHSLKKLRLGRGDSLLDIGCGWGALVMRAVEAFDAVATGITLSEEQLIGANEAIKSRGIGDRASVRLTDYGTLGTLDGRFDKIVSIGMIEHVGKGHLAEFVQSIEKLLRPGGLALLHTITSVKEGPVNRWIEEYIFPGGYIPTLSELMTHLSRRDLRVWDVENLGPHYRLTLDQWSNRFEAAVPRVLEKFSDRFVRMWRLYLRAASAAFREGEIEVHQILVSRGQPGDLPLTREDLCLKPTFERPR